MVAAVTITSHSSVGEFYCAISSHPFILFGMFVTRLSHTSKYYLKGQFSHELLLFPPAGYNIYFKVKHLILIFFFNYIILVIS